MQRTMKSVERREFLTQSLVLVGGCMCSAMLLGCETDVLKSSNIAIQFDVANETALAQVGNAVKKTFEGQNGGRPVLIIRKADDEFLVFSTVCTHEACEVETPKPNDADIQCLCHGSRFNVATGKVVTGPAPAPLPIFESTYDKSTQTLTIAF